MRQRINAARRAPQRKALALSLAMGLALGSGGLSATPRIDPASLSTSEVDALVAAATPAWVPAAERPTFRNQLLRTARTPPAAPAGSILVTNCDDDGAGSLRDAVGSASNGDTIDLTNLSCSTITLTSGAIVTALDDLTLQGPGVFSLTLDGNSASQNLVHLGEGTLTVSDMTLAGGTKYVEESSVTLPQGGCIESTGSVSLENAWAKYCNVISDNDQYALGGAIFASDGVSVSNSLVTASTAHSSGSGAYGGGIYSPGTITLIESTVSGNAAESEVYYAQGGGVAAGSFYNYTPGAGLFTKYSTLSSNTAEGSYAGRGLGGGIYVHGDAAIIDTTISANTAAQAAGVMLSNRGNATADWSLLSSTISGNQALRETTVSGLWLIGNDTVITDSTIAFNTAPRADGDSKYGTGVRLYNANVELQNTIIANNTSNGDADDVGGNSGSSLTGANNLIGLSTNVTVPSGTIVLTDPELEPLAGNGGPTSTHALSPTSPAIDVGNNDSGATTDQRGSGFPRIIGSAPDIGAFEYDPESDVIFRDGFDG